MPALLLFEAITTGNIPFLQQILRRFPASVNDRLNDHETVLCTVYNENTINGQADTLGMIQILLDHGADMNARCIMDKTPLFKIVRWGEVPAVKLMLEHGADPNTPDVGNRTVLYYAHDSSEIIELLLQYGAKIDIVDRYGRTPLDEAISSQQFNKAQALIAAGAKARDLFRTVCDALNDAEGTIQFLIKHGAEIDLDRHFSMRALFFSRLQGPNAQIIEEVMLAQGIDVNGLKREGEGLTALHVAAKEEDEARVQALLEANADVNAKSCIDDTPLHSLLLNKVEPDRDRLYKIAKLLIEAGADLYARNYFHLTAFQVAASEGYYEIANLMMSQITGVEESTLQNGVLIKYLQKGSRALIRNLCPLFIAVYLGYEEAVDTLIDLRHHVKKTNMNNVSLLLIAIDRRNYTIAKMLLDAGIRIDRYVYHQIPDECDVDVFKSICWLWEFDCILALKKPFIDAIEHVKLMENMNGADYLLIFYYKIGLLINKFDENFISMTGYYYPHDPNGLLSIILTSCDTKIEELKKDLVCGSLSKFDLLTIKLDSLLKILNDENNFRACKELYSSLDEKSELQTEQFVLKIRIELVIEQRKLLDSVKDFLNEAFEDVLDFVKLESLPDEIMCNILSHFNTRELKKIVKDN